MIQSYDYMSCITVRRITHLEQIPEKVRRDFPFTVECGISDSSCKVVDIDGMKLYMATILCTFDYDFFYDIPDESHQSKIRHSLEKLLTDFDFEIKESNHPSELRRCTEDDIFFGNVDVFLSGFFDEENNINVIKELRFRKNVVNKTKIEHFRYILYFSIKYFSEGLLHRDDDLPAIEHSDGTKEWFFKGERHRGGGKPAIVRADGTKIYYKHNKHHRSGDLPAFEWANGTKEWWVDGIRHRDNGQPALIRHDGIETLYENGVIKRKKS